MDKRWRAEAPSDRTGQDDMSEFPPDFSWDEWELVQTLERHFNIEREELPPLFIETIEAPLEFPAVADGFEQRVTSQVFRHLCLPRRLFPTPQRFQVLSPQWALRWPAFVLSLALCVLMLLSAIATRASFARGLQVILTGRGASTGVYLLEKYPQQVEITPAPRPLYVTLMRAVSELPYTLYWPTVLPPGYDKEPIIEMPGARSYTNGPQVVLEYMRAQGGELDIREFRAAPNLEVLQPADDGSTELFSVDGGIAIYVQGGWDRQLRWVIGQRSEMVYERDGVVLWLISEGKYPLDAQTLLTVIRSLQPVNEQIIAQYTYGVNLRQYSMALAAGVLRETSASDLVAVISTRTGSPPKFIATGNGPAIR
jgi:hypothetical protein